VVQILFRRQEYSGDSLKKASTVSRIRREERIRTIKNLADTYLEGYRLRMKSIPFAEYALSHLVQHVGKQMAVEITEKTVKDYQTARLKEKAAPKTINEEVGFLLRLLSEQGIVFGRSCDGRKL
jgi:hypothetical protein